MEMLNIINKYPTWFRCGNDYDCVLGSKLSDIDKNLLRNGFNIPLNEEILFMRDTGFWNCKDQGLVMTDQGMHVIVDNDSPSDKFIIEWKEFDRVEYKELNFYFYNGETLVATLGYDFLLKCDDEEVSGKYNRVCDLLTSLAALVTPDIDPIAEATEGRFEVAIAEAERQLSLNPENVVCLFNLGRVLYLEQCNVEEISENRVQQAINLFNKAISLTEDSFSLEILMRNIGFCYELLGQNYNARSSYIRALEYAEDKDEVMKELRGQEEQLKNIWETYTDVYDYSDRKFCMPVRDMDIAGCVVPGIDVFMMTNIPSAFKFPMGHPYPNQLYIGHPYKKELYVPYEESEEMFFMDKVHELCYLMECLGAESIEITSIKGKKISELNSSSGQYHSFGDVKLFSGDIEGCNSLNTSNDVSKHTARSYTIRLDPMNAPYLPNGLIWYGGQPQWQRLVERRLNNNILEYSENVQSSETRFTSNSEVIEIKGQAEYLWNKVGGSARKNMDTQFKSSLDTVWSVHVKFRSLKDFSSLNDTRETNTTLILTTEEQEYLTEYRACLEDDGIITDRERRLLDRIRKSLGISEERARELEESCSAPSLSEEEQEYADEIKACLEEDGRISDRERRLLNKLRVSLGISEERAKEIEALVK